MACRGPGARRDCTRESISASSGVLVGGGFETYGRRIVTRLIQAGGFEMLFAVNLVDRVTESKGPEASLYVSELIVVE